MVNEIYKNSSQKCEKAVRGHLQGIYPGVVFCSRHFGKGERCCMGQVYAGEVDWGGEDYMNICPIKGILPQKVESNALEEQVSNVSLVEQHVAA